MKSILYIRSKFIDSSVPLNLCFSATLHLSNFDGSNNVTAKVQRFLELKAE